MQELDLEQMEKAMTLEFRTPLGWKYGQVWSWCLCQGYSISGAWHLFRNSSSSTCNLLWSFEVQVELAHLRKCVWTEVDRLAYWFGWSLIFLPFGDWNDQGAGLWLSCGNTLAWLLINFFSTARILSQNHSPSVVYVSWTCVCSRRYHVHHGKGKWLLN